MTQATAIINVLPRVSSSTQIYFTVILNDDSLNQATITSSTVLYGNAKLISNDIFVAFDNLPIAIYIIATFDSVTYESVLYTKAVYGNVTPNNYRRLVQKIPKGVFTQGIDGEVVGDDMAARAQMLDDYYLDYFNTVNQVFNNVYSGEQEYEYNGTIGLLSTSAYPVELFQLLAAAATVFLNSYALELFISKYIFYRVGTISAVWVNDDIEPAGDYWQLGVMGHTELGLTTILAPNNFTPVLQNLTWTIYNAGAFTLEFETEITNLIARMSRADLGNPVIFTSVVTPTTTAEFAVTEIGPTYNLDPRLIFGKCLQYIGDSAYPLNIIGYQFLPI